MRNTSKSLHRGLATFLLVVLISGCQGGEGPGTPNIVIIMADDLGFSDIGSYGSEIHTPHLDRLAERGLRFTSFYNAGRCCPTRASLLTGLYPHQAGMGAMVSSVESEPVEGPYQGYLNNHSVTMAEVLKPAGYRAYMSGKWHVGEKEEHWPLKRGFDRYFGLISGASSYFEVIKDQPRIRRIVLDDREWLPPETGFYMTDATTEYAARFIRDHKTGDDNEAPFFLYVAYTAPHWPLHALPEDIAKYKGVYDIGWDSLRVQRFERQRVLGLIGEEVALPGRPSSIPAWEDVSNAEVWSRRMEVYAAMVDRMDQGIGEIVQALEETGSLDNTLVVFLSDNGGSPEDVTGRGLHDSTRVVGERGSYDAYREPWANASNTPFRYYKAWMHEGGILTPFIAHWPAGIEQPDRVVRREAHIIDLMATVVDISGATYPETYNGRTITPLAGESLVPLLQGEIDGGRRTLYWEHLGRKAMRQGPWKIVAPRDSPDWELYHIDQDPNELNDLSEAQSDRLEAMKAEWTVWADSVGVFDRD